MSTSRPTVSSLIAQYHELTAIERRTFYREICRRQELARQQEIAVALAVLEGKLPTTEEDLTINERRTLK